MICDLFLTYIGAAILAVRRFRTASTKPHFWIECAPCTAFYHSGFTQAVFPAHSIRLNANLALRFTHPQKKTALVVETFISRASVPLESTGFSDIKNGCRHFPSWTSVTRVLHIPKVIKEAWVSHACLDVWNRMAGVRQWIWWLIYCFNLIYTTLVM